MKAKWLKLGLVLHDDNQIANEFENKAEWRSSCRSDKPIMVMDQAITVNQSLALHYEKHIVWNGHEKKSGPVEQIIADEHLIKIIFTPIWKEAIHGMCITEIHFQYTVDAFLLYD